MDSLTLGQLLELANLTPSRAQHLTGLSDRQWRRYRNSDAAVPGWLSRLVLAGSGRLGIIEPQWAGWRIAGQTLIAPNGEHYSLGWFAGLPWYFQQLQEERRKLRARIEELEAAIPKPEPLPRLRLVWDSAMVSTTTKREQG